MDGYGRSLIKLWHVKSPALSCELDTLTPLHSSEFWLGCGILCGANAVLLHEKWEQFHYAVWSNVTWRLSCLTS